MLPGVAAGARQGLGQRRAHAGTGVHGQIEESVLDGTHWVEIHDDSERAHYAFLFRGAKGASQLAEEVEVDASQDCEALSAFLRGEVSAGLEVELESVPGEAALSEGPDRLEAVLELAHQECVGPTTGLERDQLGDQPLNILIGVESTRDDFQCLDDAFRRQLSESCEHLLEGWGFTGRKQPSQSLGAFSGVDRRVVQIASDSMEGAPGQLAQNLRGR